MALMRHTLMHMTTCRPIDRTDVSWSCHESRLSKREARQSSKREQTTVLLALRQNEHDEERERGRLLEGGDLGVRADRLDDRTRGGRVAPRPRGTFSDGFSRYRAVDK